MNNGSNSDNFKTAMFADCLANSKEIFQLIDRVFPQDACRHYQVLPLKLVGSNLTLGMLEPNNEDSVKFATSIARVFNYNLEIQLIDVQTHQIILANYPQNSPQTNRRERDGDRNQTVIDASFNPNNPSPKSNSRRIVDSAPTIISQPASSDDRSRPEPKLPELPDLPPDLDFFQDLELTPKPKPRSTPAKADTNATLFEIPPEFARQKPGNNFDNKATMIGGNPAELLAQSNDGDLDIDIDEEEAKLSQLIAETLGNLPQEAKQSPDFLPEIIGSLSWQTLLEETFKHGTEHLCLTRYSDRGGITARKSDRTQSAIDNISLPIFCSLIDEIKRMARLPREVSAHPKKVVLERLHRGERILLRLEFSVEAELEIVDIQVLRHKLLSDYEQQQMDRVSEQALQLAKQLEKTLRRIQACFDSAELNNLQELQTVHSRINHQLRMLDKQR